MERPRLSPELLIVAPMADELGGVRRRLVGRRTLSASGRKAWTGRMAGAEVVACTTGEGSRAASGLDAALDLFGPSRVWAVGVAGSLSEELAPGALLAGERIFREDEEIGRLDCGWAASASPAVRVGRLVSVGRIADAEEKRARAGRTGGEVAAIDLESAAYHARLDEAGIEHRLVRAISDGVDEALPAVVLEASRPDGSIDRGAVVRRALGRPASWPALLRLARRTRLCSEALGALCGTLVRRWK